MADQTQDQIMRALVEAQLGAVQADLDNIIKSGSLWKTVPRDVKRFLIPTLQAYYRKALKAVNDRDAALEATAEEARKRFNIRAIAHHLPAIVAEKKERWQEVAGRRFKVAGVYTARLATGEDVVITITTDNGFDAAIQRKGDLSQAGRVSTRKVDWDGIQEAKIRFRFPDLKTEGEEG